MQIERIIFPVLRAAAKRDWAMRAVDRVLKPWNPFSPRRYTDPYPVYDEVRALGPLSYHRPLRIWTACGYDEAEAVLRSSEVSVNRTELMLAISPYTKVQQGTLDMFTNTMLMIDPPDHGRPRSLVNRAFTPRTVAALEPRVEKITLDLLHELGDNPSPDAQVDFADRLPIFVISDMLGLPRDEWDRLKRISDELARFIDPITGFDPGRMDDSVTEYRSLLGDVIAERERQPQDDMLTRLLEAEEDGDRLSRTELESMVGLLMVAGHETTAGLIGNSLLALQRSPGARRRLIEDDDIVDNAIEELIRYDSPVQGTDRIATADIEVDGQVIPEGSTIALLIGAANRDPRRYDRPNDLILDRDDPRPLSFGHGIHHCLGAALARLEARVAIPAFLRTFPDYRIDEAQTTWKRSITLRGPSSLPVTLG